MIVVLLLRAASATKGPKFLHKLVSSVILFLAMLRDERSQPREKPKHPVVGIMGLSVRRDSRGSCCGKGRNVKELPELYPCAASCLMTQGKASTVLDPLPSCRSTMLPALTLVTTLLHISEAGGFAQS